MFAGKSSAKIKEPADLLQTVLKVTMDQPLMVLTTKGRGFSLQAKQIPEVPANSAGTAVAQVCGVGCGFMPGSLGDCCLLSGTLVSTQASPGQCLVMKRVQCLAGLNTSMDAGP